ncbi:DNA-directed RNA polymerase sigma-70 factor [Azorhizobium oxalatiphilum]|uniref:DNA-directed RNA polymerase sigma-70 factor n=1 Tax=Azorhizobium oxalatiphilum TaxID=980631 RepID=A0A917BQV5_9HYPH|nr:sigma-70 family RNA polymerase sigma factor [Azorhizobium oxalatiphilum]GGF53447.1 DNA-directed RNA polymerase sigma-70 factor [Azorhizobium oxalatiphilum]
MQSESLTHILSQTFRSEKGRLVRLVQRIVGNRATAEELVQDAFLNLMKADGVDRAPAYLARAARNLAFNHLRHLRQGVELDVGEAARDSVADAAPSPEEIALYRSELRRLLEAVAALPPRRREVFVLHKFEGLSYDAVAARMGIARNTVMVQMVNALADLDRALGADTLFTEW